MKSLPTILLLLNLEKHQNLKLAQKSAESCPARIPFSKHGLLGAELGDVSPVPYSHGPASKHGVGRTSNHELPGCGSGGLCFRDDPSKPSGAP